VSEKYKVIDTDTRTVIILLIWQTGCKRENSSDNRDLMMNSAQIWESSVEKYLRQGLIVPIEDSGVYRWLGAYDQFLGYMAELLGS
jgi:hypothetical protein